MERAIIFPMRGLSVKPDDDDDDDGAARPSDRPTLPADIDGLALGARGEPAAAGRKYLAGLPSASAVTARRRASDVHRLLEAERLLAQTNRSGVRALTLDKAREVPADVSSVQLPEPAPSPPTIEVTVAMSQMIALNPKAPAATVSEAPGPGAFPAVHPDDARLTASHASWVPAAPRLVVVDAPSIPPRAKGIARRFLAGALFVILMAGALALLVTALSRRGLLHLPDVHGL